MDMPFFPNLPQDYLLCLLARLRLPAPFLRFFQWLCSAIEGAASYGGRLQHIVGVRYGIFQGGGLSGW
eukprot:2383658-Pyramimonas_sp.AAC.1